MKIVADAHIPFIKEYFQGYGELVLKPGRSISAKEVKDADLLLVRSITPVNETLLAGSRVSFVGSVTAGSDHLDTKWLAKAGIDFCVATGFNAPPVADYVVSTIAALKRKKILASDPSRRLRAAIIGVGNVGKLVVERLTALNFEIILCDPPRAHVEPHFHGVALQEITDVDLISLHVPLTSSGDFPTYHFINQDFLRRQKPGTVLLNASRGAVIDSEALLQAGQHLAWCLDVWENEPKINKTLLRATTLATPHIAGYSVQSKIRGVDMIYRLACEKQIIKPLARSPLTMPKQTLAFAGHNHHWEDIVLGVFNPVVITAMMRTLLLDTDESGHVFDEMRNQFNYRHEFAYTRIEGDIPDAEIALLNKLQLRCI